MGALGYVYMRNSTLRDLFQPVQSILQPAWIFRFLCRLDMKLMFKLRNWERFHFQVAHEQRQVHHERIVQV